MNQRSSPSSRSEQASPTRITDPVMRGEFRRAAIWTAVVGGAFIAWTIAQPILIIIGALVFAAVIDGGVRLLGRVLKIGRNYRVTIVLLAFLAFLIWLGYFAGTQIAAQAAEFSTLISLQLERLMDFAAANGIVPNQDSIRDLLGQFSSGVGTITRAIGGVFGVLTTLLLIAIIGIFIAIDPNVYERGVSWMVNREKRDDFHELTVRLGKTLRRLMAGRLLGMLIEGIFTYILLALYGVPMAALLALLTGLLAFIPNIGALVSGVLMVLVGFSGGVEMGIYTIFVYFAVQTIDGYILIPMIAKKTVELAPALVLAAQLILGALFGILGVALADPILAMIKTALEQRSEHNDRDDALKADHAKRARQKKASAAE